MTFTLGNPSTNGSVSLSAVAFSNTLPSGLEMANDASVLSNNCGGTLTATPGDTTLSLLGGQLPAAGAGGSECTVTVPVTSTSAGTDIDITGAVSAFSGVITGTNAPAGQFTVDAPPQAPTIEAAFESSKVASGGTVPLTFTIGNSNDTGNLTGLGFVDALPDGMTVATPSDASGSCLSTYFGSETAAGGSAQIALAALTLPAGATCTYTVDVAVTGSGPLTDSSGQLDGDYDYGGPTTLPLHTAATTANVSAFMAPQAVVVFSPAEFAAGDSSTLTVRTTNPNSGDALSGVGFSGPLPDGLTAADTVTVGAGCGSDAEATVSGGALTLTDATVAAGADCTVSLAITATAAGNYEYTTGAIGSNEGGAGTAATASATVDPVPPPPDTTTTTPTDTQTTPAPPTVTSPTPSSPTPASPPPASPPPANLLPPNPPPTTTPPPTGTPLPSNAFKLSQQTARVKTGLVRLKLTVPGRGRIQVLETAWDVLLTHPAHGQKSAIPRRVTDRGTGRKPGADRFAFATRGMNVNSGRLTVQVKPNAYGKRAARDNPRGYSLNVWVVYTPAGGAANTHAILHFELAAGR